ncbi:MAG: GntR family transcriptional regulator, partial [Polaribacter sp.]
ELILKEEYQNGDTFLPKEVTMSKKLGISRNTIRQAINKLANEGLIERKKGIGTKVITKKISTRLDNWISFTAEMKSQGREVVTYFLKITLVTPSEKVRKVLSLSASKKVWMLQRIRGAKDARYLYSVSFFHPRIGITGDENFSKPLYELIEKEHDIIVVTSREKLRAIKAEKNIATYLEIKEGIAVLERERLVLDAGNKPVEYNLVYYNTDYFTYDIDIKREI